MGTRRWVWVRVAVPPARDGARCALLGTQGRGVCRGCGARVGLGLGVAVPGGRGVRARRGYGNGGGGVTRC